MLECDSWKRKPEPNKRGEELLRILKVRFLFESLANNLVNFAMANTLQPEPLELPPIGREALLRMVRRYEERQPQSRPVGPSTQEKSTRARPAVKPARLDKKAGPA